MLTLSDIANYELAITPDGVINLANITDKNIILYFYPKDSTPGCTIEGKNFRDYYERFQQLNTEIYGVSRDSIESHNKFKTKHQFPFELISDPEGQLCHQLDIIKEKNLFGKKIKGIVRSTFLFNTQGELITEWRKVSIKDHVTAVLAAVTELAK